MAELAIKRVGDAPKQLNMKRVGDAPQPAAPAPAVEGTVEEVKNSDELLPFERRAMLSPDKRPEVKNEDGTVSTHRMAAEVVDGQWYAFPTLVLQEDGSLKSFDDPFEALEYNKGIGNVRPFGEDKDAALAYSKGGYKKGTPLEQKAETNMFVEDSVFYSDIGKHAESDHGNVPVDTKDAKEADSKTKTKDLGYGHKVKPDEDTSGIIHGIKFKNDDGSYIELTEEQKVTILNKDMESELSIARKKGWDTKLKAIGTTWDDLETPYKQSLTSLAYNTGGSVAGGEFTAVLKAAKDGDVKEFAKQLRRNDNGKKTAGMDNRVAKELYYSGLIKSFSEVSKELPLGKASVAGIPK